MLVRDGATVNFKLALYKVLLSCGSDDLTCSWYDSDRDYVGYGKTLFLKKGTYSINATKNFVEYKATFGVGGKSYCQTYQR